MGIDREDKTERRARLEALLREADALRARSEAVRTRAAKLLEDSTRLADESARQDQREALIRRASESLKAAKAGLPDIRRFPVGRRRKRG